ncbi:MAG: hypothetical protein ACXWJN_01375 [Methyloceanibacter sp.]
MRHILLDKRQEGREARSWIARTGKSDDNSQGKTLLKGHGLSDYSRLSAG